MLFYKSNKKACIFLYMWYNIKYRAHYIPDVRGRKSTFRSNSGVLKASENGARVYPASPLFRKEF